ncbi:hypothetical protein OQA88_10657 [Cercophora sp. LCS_1]
MSQSPLTSPNPSSTGSPPSSPSLQPPGSEPGSSRNLILCFDGTGNAFSGSNGDTNVVKLLHKLERNDPRQFHYYQTGIGTYDVSSATVDKAPIASFRAKIAQTLDMGFGTGFDAHVMAGYRFLMRYYESGDKIYMFGFSRGAFTAKFLARMIHTVGLLCKGNEEMVPFAYRLYQRYLAGQIQQFDSQGGDRSGTIYDPTHDPVAHGGANDEITMFSNTFCRKEQVVNSETGKAEEDNIKVFFLGMWDCVNSVAVLDRVAPRPTAIIGTAKYVRHAVAVDERRVKFKPALLAQDIRASAKNPHVEEEDIKEVWFPGCHGDVGGGWSPSSGPTNEAKDIDSGPLQMSDIPLAWMINELEQLQTGIVWRKALVDKFWARLHKHKHQALQGAMHDSLRFGCGTKAPKVIGWNILEWFPFIKRWELNGRDWELVGPLPLNGGSPRDIPADATLHESLIWRLRNDSSYQPQNNHGGDSSPCLGRETEFEDLQKDTWRGHNIYKLKARGKNTL